jgi:hypothetical protein
MVGKGQRDDAVIMTAKLLVLFHLRPFVNSNFAVIASSIKVIMAKL